MKRPAARSSAWFTLRATMVTLCVLAAGCETSQRTDTSTPPVGDRASADVPAPHNAPAPAPDPNPAPDFSGGPGTDLADALNTTATDPISDDPPPIDQAEPPIRDDRRIATNDDRADEQRRAAIPMPEPLIIRPAEGIEVLTREQTVRLSGFAILDEGWLEQIACSPGTREHEALVLLPQTPSIIHAALLMAGFESGRPGSWSYNFETETFDFIEPQGSRLALEVEYTHPATDELIREPIRLWIRDHLGQQEFPDEPYVFAGSIFEPAPDWLQQQTGQSELYVADMSGSVIGLVTFGDELIGFSRVLSDDASMQPPEWEVNSDHVPPPGTPVTLIIKPWDQR